MPINDYGERADIVYSPESTINRMNLNQLYEQFLNCCSSTIMRELRNPPNGTLDYVAGYYRILEFIRDVNPDYAAIVEKVASTDQKRYEFTKEALDKDQIVLVVPSFLETLTPEWCLKMVEKYNVRATPVSYNLRDSNGKLIRRVRTKKPVYIGKKYLYILCKIPYPRSCAVAYVNQYKIPIRIKEKRVKEGYPVGLTPIRLGEDEVRNLVMSIGEGMTSKILAIYANNPEATDKLVEELLTNPRPMRLEALYQDFSELDSSNQTFKVYNHLMNTVGVDSVNTIASPEEIEKISHIEENFQW